MVNNAGFSSQERHKEWTKGSKTRSSDYSLQVRALPVKCTRWIWKFLTNKQNPWCHLACILLNFESWFEVIGKKHNFTCNLSKIIGTYISRTCKPNKRVKEEFYNFWVKEKSHKKEMIISIIASPIELALDCLAYSPLFGQHFVLFGSSNCCFSSV